MKQNLVALIDLGSNSIRLVIYKLADQGNYKEIENVKKSVRLINYINNKSKISKEGITLIIQTLLEFKKTTNSYGISQIAGFATAVIRRARNQQEILTEVSNKTGLSLKVLSEYEEAYYGYLGVIKSMDIENGITIDTGGGSTEITLFENDQMIHYHSFPFGTITLNNEFTEGEKISDKQIDYLKSYLITQYQTQSWLINLHYPVIGIGGNAKNIARISKSKSKLKYSELEIIFTDICSLPLWKRKRIEGLSKKRKDIIIPGMQTILTLMEVSKAPHFIYSGTTLRDGIAHDEFIHRTV